MSTTTSTTTPTPKPPLQDASLTADFYSTLGSFYSDMYSADPGLLHFLHTLLTSHLTPTSHILDVGCGTGQPVALTLAHAGHRVSGIDISPEMVRLSRLAVPAADFAVADMQTYAPPAGVEFDAVMMVLSLFAFQREGIEAMVERYAGFLPKGGLLCVGTLAAEDVDVVGKSEGFDGDGRCAQDIDSMFMGHNVKITLFTLDGWRWLCAKVGLEIVEEVRMLFVPPAEAKTDDEVHYFFVARKK